MFGILKNIFSYDSDNRQIDESRNNQNKAKKEIDFTKAKFIRVFTEYDSSFIVYGEGLFPKSFVEPFTNTKFCYHESHAATDDQECLSLYDSANNNHYEWFYNIRHTNISEFYDYINNENNRYNVNAILNEYEEKYRVKLTQYKNAKKIKEDQESYAKELSKKINNILN